MNIMISAVGMGNGFAVAGDSGEWFLFMVAFSGLGLLLLSIAGCMLRGCESRQQSAVRYTRIRR
ncbi:MAG TPA: hypothetical protein DCZ01_06405 [Elusimicrobia bacterium]|nr:hypothetical protein [Elusimicrobiota bacterium]